jgi:hypothetical protein
MNRKVLFTITLITSIILIGGWHLFAGNKIIGEWTGVDKTGKRASFVFHNDGTGKMLSDSKQLVFKYKYYSSKEPFWLDLDIKLPSNQVEMKFIGRFKEDNKLELYTFFAKNRPTEFPKSSEGIILLNKVK